MPRPPYTLVLELRSPDKDDDLLDITEDLRSVELETLGRGKIELVVDGNRYEMRVQNVRVRMS